MGLKLIITNILVVIIACGIIYILSGGEVTRAQLSVAAMIMYFQAVSFATKINRRKYDM